MKTSEMLEKMKAVGIGPAYEKLLDEIKREVAELERAVLAAHEVERRLVSTGDEHTDGLLDKLRDTLNTPTVKRLIEQEAQ